MTIKKIRPLFTSIITTMDKYIDADVMTTGGIIDASKLKSGIKEYQTVIAVGDAVRNVKVGDVVCINPDAYAVRKYSPNSMKNDLMENTVQSYNFNVVSIDNKDYLMLQERDIEFVIEDYTE